MITENQIRNALLDYIDGQDLDRLEDWLAQKSWNMHLDSSPSAQKLVANIQMAISEYDLHNISDVELRRYLSDLADDYSVSVAIDATLRSTPVFSTGSRMVQLKVLRAVSV